MPEPHRRELPTSQAGGGSWVWPRWLERQLDVGSPWWLPGETALANVWNRNWTLLGLPDRGERWIVDPCGLVAAQGASWALDWWVGADDGWLLPSRAAGTRQRALQSAPVVETVLRHAAGEVVHRCWADASAGGGLVVTVTNADGPAVAVALAVRPATPEGVGRAARISLQRGSVLVDGTPAMVANELPRHSALSTGSEGDVAATVCAGRAAAHTDAETTCRDGWATAAMVWPLAPRATLRVILPPLAAPARRPRKAVAPAPTTDPPERVAAGWLARAGRRVRLELPAGRLAEAATAVRCQLLLGPPPSPGASPLAADPWIGAEWVVAAATAGLHEEARSTLASWWASGGLARRAHPGGVAAALWALAAASSLPGAPPAEGPDPVVLIRAVGVLRPGQGPAAADAVRALAGLRGGADLLAAAGEGDAARQAAGWARELAARLTGDRLHLDWLDGDWRAADLARRLGLPLATAAATAAATEREPAGWPPVTARRPVPGWSPAEALAGAASAALASADPSRPLEWALGAAGPAWAWPGAVHPQRSTGTGGPGHDLEAAVRAWRAVRALLVDDGLDALGWSPTGQRDEPADGRPKEVTLRLLPWWLPSWTGQSVEVHGLPTVAGPLSWAVRWHGTRPALLWQLDGAGPEVRLSAPGLDPGWAGRGRSGDALLAGRPAEPPAETLAEPPAERAGGAG